jgi:hypothetical protein
VSYAEQWRALANRIRSLRSAAELYAQFLIGSQTDSYGAGKELGTHCQSILGALKGFYQLFHTTLPPDAKDCLQRFLDGHPAKVIADADAAREAKAGIVFLAALESEMSFLLAGRQELIRARSERAFLHLQRLLIVDGDVRAKWKAAFEGVGEISCEQLGGVHLLWHGIWAFKINADGARTDLVFPEPIEESFEQRGIEGLVLTEWKLADATNARARFEEARKQATLYTQGPLVGTELSGYRYAVVVSLKDLSTADVPDDLDVGGVIYRHINIAIEPRRPSKQARSK